MVFSISAYTSAGIYTFPDQKYWILFWAAVLVLTVYIPKKPVVFLFIFIILAFGTPRYGTPKEVLYHLNVLNLLCLLGFLGVMVWTAKNRTEVYLPVNAVSCLLLLFLIWILVSIIVNYNLGLDKTRLLINHGRNQYIYIFFCFFMASRFLNTETAGLLVIYAACMAVFIRGLVLWLSEALYLTSDIGMFSAVVFPLCIFLAFHHKHIWLRIFFGVLTCFSPALILQTENRTAGITFIVVLTGLFFITSHKLKFMAAAVPGIAVLIHYFPVGYFDRFRVIWDKTAGHATVGLDMGTMIERLELWGKGFEIFRQNLVFGIGPENYGYYVKQFSDQNFRVAHNSVVNVAAETGIPGLILYLLLCLTVIFILLRNSLKRKEQKKAILCGYIFTAVLGCFAAGMFSSRHDDAFMYLLFGWGVALTAEKSLMLKNRWFHIHPLSEDPVY
nr:O-antigen ligase family protein [Desulfobacula sp.]